MLNRKKPTLSTPAISKPKAQKVVKSRPTKKPLHRKLIEFVIDRKRSFGTVHLDATALTSLGLKLPKYIEVTKGESDLAEIDVIKPQVSFTHNECKFDVRHNVPFILSDGKHEVGAVYKYRKDGGKLECFDLTDIRKDKWVSNRTKYRFDVVDI